MTWNQIFGFFDRTLEICAQRLEKIFNLEPRRRNSAEWGQYYMFGQSVGHEHVLVWNEIPAPHTDPDEAAEPQFLSWKCILWVAYGLESAELTEALISQGGARLLRPKRFSASDLQ